MGSGNHVLTYLHQEVDGTLIELPLAWYAELGGHWGMNPGYDNLRLMRRRQIAYECMFCHNAYPEIPATAHRDLSANPVYNGPLPEGIDCQRCHGPGAAHVKTAQSPGVSAPQIRALILNPARLNNEHKIVNAPYRLRQSQCYLKSEGALSCETCHNPHDLHKGPESARTTRPFA